MTDWLDQQLEAAGLRRTSDVTHPVQQPWGDVFTASTTAGAVFLKAPGPGTVFEVALYPVLARVLPDLVLTPIAVDVDRGWLLLPDGGATIEDPEAFVAVLPRYGQLQRELAPHVDELLANGVPDMRPAVLRTRFDEAVEIVSAAIESDLDRNRHQKVLGLTDRVEEAIAELGASPVPASLDHNDLQSWNVFTDGRLYDWGDSVIAHPFASMLFGLGVLQMQLGVPFDDPALLRARDAYLEPFSDLAPHAQLARELELACWLGKIARALTWERSIRAAEDAGEFADAPMVTLHSMLADSCFALHL